MVRLLFPAAGLPALMGMTQSPPEWLSSETSQDFGVIGYSGHGAFPTDEPHRALGSGSQLWGAGQVSARQGLRTCCFPSCPQSGHTALLDMHGLQFVVLTGALVV